MIDRVYIVCNKNDFYFARVCIASVRHWNKTIPVTLIKDLGKGNFETGLLESTFNISIAPAALKNMGYYVKLWPFIENEQEEKIMIQDADTVWMCDMIAQLAHYEADLMVDGYDPANLEDEMKRWFFDPKKLEKEFPEYQYPGFLFNVGQMVCNSNVFPKKEILKFVFWKEDPEPKIPDLFFYEQGILNFIAAEKLKSGELSVAHPGIHRWGWDPIINKISVDEKEGRKNHPFLVHWYGHKHGLFSILPGAAILKKHETDYFRKTGEGLFSMHMQRLGRTLKKPARFIYHYVKKFNGKA